MGKNLVADHLVRDKKLEGSSLENIIFTHPKYSLVTYHFFGLDLGIMRFIPSALA